MSLVQWRKPRRKRPRTSLQICIGCDCHDVELIAGGTHLFYRFGCPACGAKFQVSTQDANEVRPSMVKVRSELLVNRVSFAHAATLRNMEKDFRNGLFTGTVLYWSHGIHSKYYAGEYSRIALYITWIRSKGFNPWINLLGDDEWHMVCSFIFPPVIGADMKYKCRICQGDTFLFGLDKQGYPKHWWKCQNEKCSCFTRGYASSIECTTDD